MKADVLSTKLAFYKLTLDWIYLHKHLPRPASGEAQRISRQQTDYGHPAEWASDKAALISHTLWSWHDMLAEARKETAPRRDVAEKVIVINAWKYLEPRFQYLVDLVDREDLEEISELHKTVARVLGTATPTITLPFPCPHPACGLKTLQRHVRVGSDLIICGACGYDVPEDQYPFLVRVLLDTLINA